MRHIAETAGFTPGILERKPELPDSLVPWMDAFNAASAARGFVIAAGATKVIRLPLPLTIGEILTTAEAFGLPREEFLHVAQILDHVYMAADAARQ